MPVPEKQIHHQTFEEGMDTVTARELIPSNRAKSIYNCVIRSSGKGNVGIVTNLKGNLLVETPLPAGQNKCIGVANDEEANKFYMFIWNSMSLHTILMYNGLTNSVSKVLENLTDTGNIDIMRLNKDFLILHADVVRNNLLYWVDGYNNARKTNISRLLDKSPTGYGDTILQSFIDAYKQTSPFAPTASYFSDTSKPFNRMYGALRKFAQRNTCFDGERSNWSDFSAVTLPSKEPFTGINIIPTENNGINIIVNTGDRDVSVIEIAMQSTDANTSDDTTLNWVLIATINKKKLGLTDNTQYTYKYYNDSPPVPIDQEKIIRPYSYMPKQPLCQAFVQNAMVYSNAKEGFPSIDLDVDVSVAYEDLFLEDGIENEFNKPFYRWDSTDTDYVGGFGARVTNVNGVEEIITKTPVRFNQQRLIIGNDVKAGNEFVLIISNGKWDNFNITYKAINTDTAVTVANKIKSLLIGTGKIYSKTPDIPFTNIYQNDIDGDGNVTFHYIMRATRDEPYLGGYTSVQPVQFNTLKDTGQSLRNIKMGQSIKLGVEYEDFDGRKTATYTNDAMIVNIATINEMGGLKKSIISLRLNNRPPIWAKYFQIMRSNDLVYGDYIQLLIQKVVNVNSDDAQDYLDLTVGSLFTYQKIHPNTPLTYEFKKGDIIRLIKKAGSDPAVYYPSFETEIIDYKPVREDNVKSNLVSNGSNTVTVDSTDIGDIGKIILVDNHEREIIDVPSNTTYLINASLGDTTAKTYLSYTLIDRRGTIRIRKPSTITIEDNSIVELYTPSSLFYPIGDKQFFEFQKKFAIINAGTEDAMHSGDQQNQTTTQPAIINISEGTAYVRNRELPINNSFPGTQILIDTVEDPSYSDFYPSKMNDNGRTSIEDAGDGEITFGSRMRFSNNFIEDTRINGLNDFDSPDREDYNDKYGDIKLTKFDRNRILTFKELITAYVPVDERITQSNNGVAMNISSSKLLNPIQYYAWEGGIGNNPESYASNGTHKYYVSPNSGVIIRLGGNGEEPISKTYNLDNEAIEILADAVKNNAKIFGGFDRGTGMYVVSVEGYNRLIYSDGFGAWVVETDRLPNNINFDLITVPSHGTAVMLDNYRVTYTQTIGYVGPDSFTYRAFVNGSWSDPRKVCLDIIDVPVNLSWRQKESSFFCVRDQYGLRNGNKGWATLEEFNTTDNSLTGNEKPNSPTDPDYVPPIFDSTACEIEPVDNDPVPYNFTPKTNAELSNVYTSETRTIIGINVPISIVIADGEYSKNGAAFTSADGTLVNNDTIQLRNTSSNLYATSVTTTVTTGPYSTTFVITTKNNFGNELRQQEFRRNDCPVGSTGTLVTYSVQPDTFFASTQSEANDLADADIAANGQTYANDPSRGFCIINTVSSIIVCDIEGDGSLDAYAYIDTPGITENGSLANPENIAARNWRNFFLRTDPESQAFILASDNMTSGVKRRFAFNIGKLIGMYPDDVAIPVFIVKIAGRQNTASTVSAYYTLKYPDQKMTMQGAPGTYVPSVVPAGGPPVNPFDIVIPGGGDGTIEFGTGSVIITFEYNRSSNTVTVIPAT